MSGNKWFIRVLPLALLVAAAIGGWAYWRLTGVRVSNLNIGTGVAAQAQRWVTIHYVARFADGREFDSSRKRGTPFRFKLGARQVIRGLDEGIEGMKVGGIRKIDVRQDFAYGKQGSGKAVPPDSRLVFEVELLKVE